MSAFLAWIAALLAGETGGDGSDPWDAPVQPGNGTYNHSLIGNLLTLDAMLSCWARDRAIFQRIAARIDNYLAPVMAHAATIQGEDLQRLTVFQAVWTTVSNELLKDH
jgi:hypothetical protein